MPHVQSQTDLDPDEDLYNQLIGALHFPDFDSFSEQNTWTRFVECAKLGYCRVKQYEYLFYRKLVAKLPLRHQENAARLHLKTLDGLVQYALSNTSKALNGSILITDNNNDEYIEQHFSSLSENKSSIHRKSCMVLSEAEQPENNTIHTDGHLLIRTFENDQLNSTQRTINTQINYDSRIENAAETLLDLNSIYKAKYTRNNLYLEKKKNRVQLNNSKVEVIDLTNDDDSNWKNNHINTTLTSPVGKRGQSCMVMSEGSSKKQNIVASNRCNTENIDGGGSLKSLSRRNLSPKDVLSEIHLLQSIVSSDYANGRIVIQYTNKRFQCPFNNEDTATSSWNAMKKHIDLNHVEEWDEVIFQCGLCESRFKDALVLARHWEARHELVDVIPCNMCMETFQNSSDLGLHWTKVHGNPQCRFFCRWCEVGFRHYRHWIDHIDNHPDEFKCLDCEVSFYRLGGLISHRRTHQDNLDESLVWIGTRDEFIEKNHDLIHGVDDKLISKSEAKVYNCSSDKVKFSPLFTKQPINNNNAAICKICKKKFVKKKLLLKHIKIHEDPNRTFHKCAYCDMAFLNKKDLRIHRSKNHLMSCPFCRTKIHGMEELIAHKRDQHGLFVDQSDLSKEKDVPQTTCNNLNLIKTTTNCSKKAKSAKKLNHTNEPVNEDSHSNKNHLFESSKYHMNSSTESYGVNFGKNTYTCVHCGNKFKENTELYEHVQREHYCEKCHKQVRRMVSHRLFPCTSQVVTSTRKNNSRRTFTK